jgi:hypothetical protein
VLFCFWSTSSRVRSSKKPAKEEEGQLKGAISDKVIKLLGTNKGRRGAMYTSNEQDQTGISKKNTTTKARIGLEQLLTRTSCSAK